jgi:hypothetical protein
MNTPFLNKLIKDFEYLENENIISVYEKERLRELREIKNQLTEKTK